MTAESEEGILLRWIKLLISKDVRESLSGIREWISSKWRTQPDDSETDLPELLIIGPGGVGKSTLAQFLTGDFRHVESGTDRYLESYKLEEYELKAPSASIVVPPGQKHRREITWTKIETDLAAGRFSGVILVMSYGYHSIGERFVSGMSTSKDTPEAWLESYLKDCRKDEIRVLERIIPFAMRSPRKLWLLTVVTKQDLWWDRDDEVRSYYLHGDYGKVMRKLYDRHASGLQSEAAFTCLLMQNFQSGRGELLQNTIAGYDQARYNDAVRELLTKLAALRQWESNP